MKIKHNTATPVEAEGSYPLQQFANLPQPVPMTNIYIPQDTPAPLNVQISAAPDLGQMPTVYTPQPAQVPIIPAPALTQTDSSLSTVGEATTVPPSPNEPEPVQPGAVSAAASAVVVPPPYDPQAVPGAAPMTQTVQYPPIPGAAQMTSFYPPPPAQAPQTVKGASPMIHPLQFTAMPGAPLAIHPLQPMPGVGMPIVAMPCRIE
ncbi:uncharacterized protein LOC130411722 [Triplophysa dalaica]|uniref:uncharacterized protein LOC130411722 n=1 Tax=Triplophysa dalaica TaxID=1582913 RepID=UPI0024DFDDD1|nr:uncharacterized protein LOC130411722 [Triplophysa dalaica]